MKKIYILFSFLLVMGMSTKATIHVVTVQDFTFIPGTFSADPGDTIQWQWMTGVSDHTTTSLSVPAGAMTWDAPLDSASPVFNYVVNMTGNYDYECSIHGVSMGMVGNFTVTGAAFVMVQPSGYFSLNSYISFSNLVYQFQLPVAALVQVNIYNILGNHLRTLQEGYFPTGLFNQTVTVADLPKGIYFLEVQTANKRMTQKIVVE